MSEEKILTQKIAEQFLEDSAAEGPAIERSEESRSGVLDILKGKYAKAD